MSASLRDERPEDRGAVAALISAAFAGRAYASGTEAALHAALHDDGAATVALLAEDGGRIVGQILFSPVRIDGRPSRWHVLGPVAVAPGRQLQGIGTALVEAGLARLRGLGAEGCLVEGDGGYYGRFGFRPPERLALPGPPSYAFVLPFDLEPEGRASLHPAFG